MFESMNKKEQLLNHDVVNDECHLSFTFNYR